LIVRIARVKINAMQMNKGIGFVRTWRKLFRSDD